MRNPAHTDTTSQDISKIKAVNVAHHNIVLKGEVWEHNVPPCSKSALCLLANNESVVT